MYFTSDRMVVLEGWRCSAHPLMTVTAVASLLSPPVKYWLTEVAGKDYKVPTEWCGKYRWPKGRAEVVGE